MDRRAFLGKVGAGALAASAGALAAAAHATSKDGLLSAAQQLQAQIKSISERVDSMEDSQRRMLRMLIVVASLSTGFDALTLLKGDIIA